MMESVNQTTLIPASRPNNNCPQISQGVALAIRYGLNCGLSVIILIILVILQQRRHKGKHLLRGYIGIPVPMSFLVTPQHRWIYVSLFTIMGTSLLGLFFGSPHPPVDHYVFGLFWNTLFFPIIVVLEFTLIFMALFACADPSLPIVGHALGFLYSLVWYGSLILSFQVVRYLRYGSRCQLSGVMDSTALAREVVLDLPIFFLGLYVVLWYGFHVIYDIVKLILTARESSKWSRFYPITQQPHEKSFEKSNISFTGAHYYHFLHVKRLLSSQQKKDKKIVSGVKDKVINLVVRLLKFLFPWPFQYKKNFRFPVPFLGAVGAMSMILWRLTFFVAFWCFIVIDLISVPFDEQFVPFLRSDLITNLTGFLVPDEYIDIAIDAGRFVIVGIPVTAAVSVLASMLFCVYMVTHMMGAVSKHMNKVARRGFKGKKLTSPVSRVPAAWKYTGLQIGFFVYAWIIYTLVIFLAGIALGIVVLLLKYQGSWFARLLLGLLIPSVWSKLILYAQFLLCKFIFIEEAGKFVHITNQRLFNWLAFILFFYNAIIGFIGAILRAFISIAFGILLLFRLDRVVLMTGFEFMDFGHRAYIGFLYLNYNYNNAVMHVFSSLAQQAISGRKSNGFNNTLTKYDSGDSLPMKAPLESPDDKSCRSRTRWFVAYTLIKNPSLKKLRYNNLLEAAKKVEEQGHETEFVANVAAIRGKALVTKTGLDVEPTQL